MLKNKKGQAINYLILIAVGIVLLFVMWYIISKYVGGRAGEIESLGPDFVTQCQSKGELEKTGVGREFIDDDGDGSPNHCDLCKGCDDTIDNDNDGIPEGCDESDLDPKKNKGIDRDPCTYNKFARLS